MWKALVLVARRCFGVMVGLLASFLMLVLLFSHPCALRAQDVENIGSQAPLTIRGNVGASMVGNGMEGIERRQSPFSWLFSGSTVVGLYGVDIPISFVFSERERGFQQPFNEFGMKPTWKWITLHAGYSSIPWSRYTNAGVRFLGAGIELNPDIIYFSALYGRLQRGVEEDSTNRLALPAYRRMGGGAKCEIHTGWLRAGVSVFYAKDDTASLSHAPAGILPMENATVGVNPVIGAHEKVTVDLELGGRLFTRNLRSSPLRAGGYSSEAQWEYLRKAEPYFDLRT